ncbi:MAG: asparagine synthetase B [Bacteroidota bacterium]|nr:asparagine synthetase B [Bacteroidota bacterium]
MRACSLVLAVLVVAYPVRGQDILIPMDAGQTDHLKAYGVAFWALERGQPVEWLLNYRGGAFMVGNFGTLERELAVRGVIFETLSAQAAALILADVESDRANTARVRLEKPPRIAVYAPDQTLPWDDAVLLALTYAEVPYEMVYDEAVLRGDLADYDWLHLHHEDFTGQYGKFYQYRNTSWYIEQQRMAENSAARHGFHKVSHLKLDVAQTIKRYVHEGGFLFAMCSGTDTFDIALAAHATDIVPADYDGDAVDPGALRGLDYDAALAFTDFTPSFNAAEYEHSDIDTGPPPAQFQNPALDYFTMFEFSAKWDPVPSMLTQNHVSTIRGFVGQTTAFNPDLIKPEVVVLAESTLRSEAKYVHGSLGQGTFTYYAGHDPEDYQHFVGDPPTDLSLHRNSPGYRLILNNILFPAARKEKQKT